MSLKTTISDVNETLDNIKKNIDLSLNYCICFLINLHIKKKIIIMVLLCLITIRKQKQKSKMLNNAKYVPLGGGLNG